MRNAVIQHLKALLKIIDLQNYEIQVLIQRKKCSFCITELHFLFVVYFGQTNCRGIQGRFVENPNRGKIDNSKEYSHVVCAYYRQAERVASVAVVAVSRTQPSVLGARSRTA